MHIPTNEHEERTTRREEYSPPRNILVGAIFLQYITVQYNCPQLRPTRLGAMFRGPHVSMLLHELDYKIYLEITNLHFFVNQ